MRHAAPERRSRGLTLLEILMVVAILGLLVAALVVYLLPSDDRRVKLEAERLAVYLESAGAEAIMRDGPVRVAFELEAQSYDREVARVGAELHDAPFEDDPGAEANKVRAPVRVTSVLVPDAGTLASGTAWLLWRGRETEGGVAILELNEAVWSVIVDPNNGQVRAERGRAELPGLQPISRSRFATGLPSLPEGQALTAMGAVSPGAEGSIGDDVDRVHEAPPTGGAEAPTEDVPEKEPEPLPDAGAPPLPDVGAPPTEPPPDPEPDVGVEEPDAAPTEPDAGPAHACEVDSDCNATRLEKCHAHACVVDPSGKSFRLTSDAVMTTDAPNDVFGMFQTAIVPAITLNQFNLVVKFEGFGGATPTNDSPLWLYIVQATTGGSSGAGLAGFMPHPQLPSLRAQAYRTQCMQDAVACYEIHFVSDEGQIDQLKLWVPTPFPINGCRFGKFTVFAKLRVEVREVQSNGQPVALLAVEGVVRPADARKFQFRNGQGSRMTLLELFEGVDFDPNADTNGDGDPDGWLMAFRGTAQAVELNGNPAGMQGRVPPNCEP